MNMRILLVFFIIGVSSISQAVLPNAAQKYLDQIPDQRLTLPYVLKTAMFNAEVYKIIGYNHASAHLDEVEHFDSVTDYQLESGVRYTDDNSVKTNPFQALRSRSAEWSLGVAKNWSTGTFTSLKWVHDNNQLEFDTSLGGFSGAFVNEYKQSAAELQLQQSLLQNSFGYSFRRKREGARLRAKSIKWQVREDLEVATIGIVDQFYQSWILQQQVASLNSQVERQSRLVRILKRRAQKGVVEKPDLIQVEALLVASRARLQAVRAQLVNRWEKLVIDLKLPEDFLQVDPMKIPTAIDNPVPLGLRVCGQKDPRKTAEVYKLERTLEALESEYHASENDSLPDLKLIAGYRGNSIDTQASKTFEDVIRGRDEDGIGLGPTWNVGLQLKWPLNNSAARAQQARKYIQKEQTLAQLKIAVDNLNSQWRDSCRRLRLEWSIEKNYQEVVRQQSKRVSQEERRFSLGRITVNDLVTAENDLNDWEFRSQQKSIEVRQLAWQVQRYSGELYKVLEPIVKLMQKGET